MICSLQKNCYLLFKKLSAPKDYSLKTCTEKLLSNTPDISEALFISNLELEKQLNSQNDPTKRRLGKYLQN